MRCPRIRYRWIPIALLAALFVVCALGAVAAQEDAAGPEPPPPIPAIRVPVDRIEFTGNTAIESEGLRKFAEIEPGQTISPDLLAEAIRKIEAAYTDRGYIGAVTQVEIRGEEPPRTLVFHIREAAVSKVVIQGLRRTRERAVRRLLDLKPGDVFSRLILQRDLQRLNELAIFEEIQAFLQAGDEPGEVVVIWNVKEQKTGEISLGGSFSPEGNLAGEVRFTQANLFGRAQRLSVSANVGTTEGRLGGEVAYFNPFIAAPRTSLFLRGFSAVSFRFSEDLADEPGVGRYFERRTGIQAAATRPLDEKRRISLGLRFENLSVENLPLQFLSPAISSSDGTLAVSSARYVEDRRLFLVIPASGSYFSGFVEAGQVSPDDGTAGGIAKVSFERNWYFPLDRIEPETPAAGEPRPVRTVALSLKAGTSFGDLPFFEQFFVGGVTDLRGYREDRFWGQHFVTLNTELRWPLTSSLIALAFVDVGDAWHSDFQFFGPVRTDFGQHLDFSPRLGAGVGLWWASTFGLFRLELARGEDTRVHFMVGESF